MEDEYCFALSGRRTHSGNKTELPGNVTKLKFIFGPTALQALDLVDQRSVTRVTSPSGRTTFQVTGSSGKMYTCYSFCHYCSCPAFSFSVLRKNESLLCKHILAVYLSQATGTCQERTVSDEQICDILLAKEL
ncbi:zinc finger SWIM domain-containing protein 7 isoform X2 [Pelobates fuscus]|uniref:zinc finger SWIM domain-containing protein 7 isoform X2 n=1 Tax=Pelobates fuscus TaxID=191477 RepID=UPI002FE4E591